MASLSDSTPEKPLEIGDRVLWPGDHGNEYGTVRWIGLLPDDTSGLTIVGVEFDNKVGTGTGKYKSHRLFRTKPGYASLVPLLGLIKADSSQFNIQVDGDVGHLNVAEQINVQHNTYNKLKNCNTHFSCGDVTYNAANSAAQVTRTGAANVNVDDAANINIDGAATVNVAENINVSHFTQNKTVNNTLMGYEQIKDQSKTVMESNFRHFNKERSPFYVKAVQLLKDNRLLIITGPQGSGKTTLGCALLHYYSLQNYTPLILHMPFEWRILIGGDNRNIVLLDLIDKNDRGDKILKKWSPHFSCMIEFAKSGKCLTVIILCPETLKYQSQEYRKELDQFPMVNLS